MFIFSWKKFNKFKLRDRICLLLVGKMFFLGGFIATLSKNLFKEPIFIFQNYFYLKYFHSFERIEFISFLESLKEYLQKCT